MAAADRIEPVAMLVVVVAMASAATDRMEHVAMRDARGGSSYGVGNN